MTRHPKTDEAVQQFIADFRAWNLEQPAATVVEREVVVAR
jgi:hypothetical protein